MIKKKAAGDTVGSESYPAGSVNPEIVKRDIAAKKKANRNRRMDAAQVHEQIAGVVKASATEIAQALIARALDGDTPAAKYLFEFARIFPTADQTNAEAKEEDSLAKTLMHRLNLPEEPIKIDDDEDGKPEATSATDVASSSEVVQDHEGAK